MLSHRTAVCPVVIDGRVYFYFKDCKINIFAWGAGSAAKKKTAGEAAGQAVGEHAGEAAGEEVEGPASEEGPEEMNNAAAGEEVHSGASDTDVEENNNGLEFNVEGNEESSLVTESENDSDNMPISKAVHLARERKRIIGNLKTRKDTMSQKRVSPKKQRKRRLPTGTTKALFHK